MNNAVPRGHCSRSLMTDDRFWLWLPAVNVPTITIYRGQDVEPPASRSKLLAFQSFRHGSHSAPACEHHAVQRCTRTEKQRTSLLTPMISSTVRPLYPHVPTGCGDPELLCTTREVRIHWTYRKPNPGRPAHIRFIYWLMYPVLN
jgi:hypothetical protein